jgi:hypothetical protein
VAFWSNRPAGFNMLSLHEMTANSGHPRTLQAEHLLGAPAVGASIDLFADNSAIAVAAEIAIARAGTLNGAGGWFAAALSPSVTMSNAPLAENRIVRRGVVFPIPRPVAVNAGDRVSLRMRIMPVHKLVSWTVTLFRGQDLEASERFQQSTLRGMLLDPGQVRRTRPEYVPKLTARGRARMTVLDLCDGRRRIDAIEREVYERHPALFADHAAAALFVAEVVAGYSE